MLITKYLLCLSLFYPALGFFQSQLTEPSHPKQEVMAQDSAAVKIKLVPIDVPAPRKGTPYKVDSSMRVKIRVTNNSNEPIKALVVDTYHQNRPRLLKNGEVVPYRKGIDNLIHSKDSEFTFVRVGSIVLIPPTNTTDLEDLILSDWYDQLKPGSYKLINRHRFEVDGAWSSDSAPLLFEVVVPK